MPLRVLVGSPDSSASGILERDLNRRGYELLAPCLPQDAMEAVLREEPDILVLDIDRDQDAPGRMIHALRKARPHLRVIALSAASSIEHADVLDEVFTYMTKPVAKELVEAVKAAGRALERRRIEEGIRT